MHDIDYTGTRALRDVLDQLDRQHIVLGLARPGAYMLENLARSGLLERIGTDHLFPSVNAAVTTLGLEENSPERHRPDGSSALPAST
jgi:SulP family sulfate permease